MIAAGVAAVAMSLGLAGAGVASAASPVTGHIKAGSDWSLAMNDGSCEIEHFASNGTFISPDGGSGGWRQTATTVIMKMNYGLFSGLKFKGTYVAHRFEFSGKFKDASGAVVGTGDLYAGVPPACQPAGPVRKLQQS
jgi:hypothetical protein